MSLFPKRSKSSVRMSLRSSGFQKLVSDYFGKACFRDPSQTMRSPLWDMAPIVPVFGSRQSKNCFLNEGGLNRDFSDGRDPIRCAAGVFEIGTRSVQIKTTAQRQWSLEWARMDSNHDACPASPSQDVNPVVYNPYRGLHGSPISRAVGTGQSG